MRIMMYGSGAVGGYFGGRLAAAGNSVGFVARGRTLAALRSTGLKISSPLGDLHLPQVEADDEPEQLAPADVVIVAVKAWQVPGVADRLATFLPADCVVLPLENGVEAPGQLVAALGAERVLGGLCRILAQVEEPGHVRHLGAEPFIALGEMDDRNSERVALLRQTFENAGIAVQVPESIQGALWEKFLLISAISGLGAVSRMPIGVLRSTPETRELLAAAMGEIRDVALAREIPVAPDIVGRTMTFFDRLPESSTASMQRDVMEGRPSELEAQNGAVVRLGREAGVATPINEFIYHVLLPLERAARNQREGD